jgi:hypothetical protein
MKRNRGDIKSSTLKTGLVIAIGTPDCCHEILIKEVDGKICIEELNTTGFNEPVRVYEV